MYEVLTTSLNRGEIITRSRSREIRSTYVLTDGKRLEPSFDSGERGR